MTLSSRQKLWLAKAWINLMLGILILACIGCFGLMIWGLLSVIDPKMWIVLGVILGVVAVITALVSISNKAEKYIDKHGGH